MADNYLEKKMDDYRRGTGARPMHRTQSPLKPGHVAVCYPPATMFIAAAKPDEILRAVVTTMRRLGARITITCTNDKKKAKDTAWSAGATFDPSDNIADAIDSDRRRRGTGHSALVFIDTTPETVSQGKTIVIGNKISSGNYHVIDSSLGPDTIAAAIAFLTHPAASQIAPVGFADRREKP